LIYSAVDALKGLIGTSSCNIYFCNLTKPKCPAKKKKKEKIKKNSRSYATKTMKRTVAMGEGQIQTGTPATKGKWGCTAAGCYFHWKGGRSG
jgi:hypothetical protein